MDKSITTKLNKLLLTPISEGEKFLKTLKPQHTEFLSNVLHTTKAFIPEELKAHVRHVLRATSARIAKGRMLKAHRETAGGFFDYLKKGASAVGQVVQNAGSQILAGAKDVYDKAVPYAQKGWEAAKPLIKEHGPSLVGKAAEMIPVVGPIAGPIAKKGTELLFGKLFGGALPVGGGALPTPQQMFPQYGDMMRFLSGILGRHLRQMGMFFEEELFETIASYVSTMRQGQPAPTRAVLTADLRDLVVRNVHGYIQPSLIDDIVEELEKEIRRRFLTP